MDTDNSVVKARERGKEAGWRRAKRGKMGDICNGVTNKKLNTHA